MPIRFDNTCEPEDIAEAIEFAVDNGARIISNSWGYYSQCSDSEGAILTAIEYAINHNVLVIFAAGNNAMHALPGDPVSGFVEYPANRNLSGMLTVGASDRYDHQADNSPTSSYIDIVAPSNRASRYESNITYPFAEDERSDMWTIDIPGNSGYNPWHTDQGTEIDPDETLPYSGSNYLSYTGHFGGTSHSCPVVAGVAALVLSVNPDLTPQDVCKILTRTADKVGGYSYDNSGRCDEMGYGRVNANRAVWDACDTDTINSLSLYDQVDTIVGCDIYIEQGEVLGNSILRVRARNSVTIDNDTYIGLGSVLDIKRYEE